jgi:hypothetical protein
MIGKFRKQVLAYDSSERFRIAEESSRETPSRPSPEPFFTVHSHQGAVLAMVLWLFILRGIALEFRDHIASPVWTPFWDVCLPTFREPPQCNLMLDPV